MTNSFSCKPLLKRKTLALAVGLNILLLAACGQEETQTPAPAQQNAEPAAATAEVSTNDNISGVVQGPSGPEAGVWVIAETDSQPTRYAKIVVTDDAGRFLIPD